MISGHPQITVLLIDDHPVVRDGYRRILENTLDIKVVAEADDGETGYKLYRQSKPDVVVLDLNMPGFGGLETIHRIRAHDPDAHILVFSMHSNEIMVQRAIEMGATGYLTKQGGMGQMVHAVREVRQGKVYIDQEHLPSVISDGKLQDSGRGTLNGLSKREFQLFKLLAEGSSISEIADVLCISPKTVGVHHANIMKKLNLHNATQLVRLAINHNIIEP